MNTVLFLCTGNYYRSRYAEEVFNYRARRAALDWRAFSRGAAERGSPDNVGPMSPYAIDALKANGIVAEGLARAPRPCVVQDFENASLVIAVHEVEHRPMIERRFPEVAARVRYWAVADIEFLDPAIALQAIDDHVHRLLSELGAPTDIGRTPKRYTRNVAPPRCWRPAWMTVVHLSAFATMSRGRIEPKA